MKKCAPWFFNDFFDKFCSLCSGDWKNLEFKEYNLNAEAPPIQAGYMHSLLEVGLVSSHPSLVFAAWILFLSCWVQS